MSEAHRSHPAIPLSPPSPPAEGVKEASESHHPDYTPHSPASPFMSVATKSYGQSFAEAQASSVSVAAQRSPSPPISAPMSAQVSQQPSLTASNPFPTPENSVIGQTRRAPDEFDDGHITKRQRLDNEVTAAQQISEPTLKSISIASLHMENDSQSSELQPIDPGNAPAPAIPLQKTTEKATQPAPDEMSLEQLQKNVGEVFHLCKSALPRIRPDPSQHLLSRYRLSDLHAKVARTDPVTLAKINKLRKSYEGQIKNFALAGRNKPAKDEIAEGEWSSLNMMMLEPEESWFASKVVGKNIEVNADTKARMQKGLFLQPGRTRDHALWDDLLGHEKARQVQAQDSVGRKVGPGPMMGQRPLLNGTAGRTLSHSAAAAAAGAGGGGAEAVRPRRTGKKRSYADNSFEGYGDGFVDDEAVDMDQGFLSNSEDGSHGPGRKKRKKDHALSGSATTTTTTTTMYGGAAPSSYGVGGWNAADR